jgi:hypothetical protein
MIRHGSLQTFMAVYYLQTRTLTKKSYVVIYKNVAGNWQWHTSLKCHLLHLTLHTSLKCHLLHLTLTYHVSCYEQLSHLILYIYIVTHKSWFNPTTYCTTPPNAYIAVCMNKRRISTHALVNLISSLFLSVEMQGLSGCVWEIKFLSKQRSVCFWQLLALSSTLLHKKMLT